MRGSSASMATIATTPSAHITQKVARQPQRPPIAVPAGTPITLETVSPERMTATARPR